METIEQQQIHYLEGLLSNTLPGTWDHVQYLRGLADLYDAKFSRSCDISDLEKCIEWRQRELASAPGGDFITDVRLLNLGADLLRAFQCNHRASFLEESISLLRHLLKMPGTQGSTQLGALGVLWACHVERWTLLHQRNDLDEVVHLLQMCIAHKSAIPPDKLKSACSWVNVARWTGHPSISTACETAMSRKTPLFLHLLSIHSMLTLSAFKALTRCP
jgi:hypothetical protein